MKKILIIEEDSSFAELLKARLSDEYQIELCEDGQSGYYAIYELKPDLVVVSLTIAQMDAVSLVGKMRVQKQFQKLPIFVLANQKTLLRADEALATGANQAFLKDESGAINSVISAISVAMRPSLARKAASPSEPVLVYSGAPPARAAIPFTGLPMGASSLSGVAASKVNSVGTGVLSVPIARTVSPGAALREIEAAAFDRGGFEVRQELGVSADSGSSHPSMAAFLDLYGQRAHSVRQDFIRYRTASENERPEHLTTLLESISELNSEARECGLGGLSRYLSVIESRVRQFLETGSAISPGSLQGLAAALDGLASLNNHLEELEPLNNLNPLALIVDDDSVCRKTVSLGLEKSKIKTTAVDNPDAGLLEAESKPFDLIFLDIDLPKMNGFALCARMRIIPCHRKTPILFVTALNDIKSRASSRVSGGNDFITKPINLYELGINSWTLIINRRVLQNAPAIRA